MFTDTKVIENITLIKQIKDDIMGAEFIFCLFT